jgi:hypothetical protein
MRSGPLPSDVEMWSITRERLACAGSKAYSIVVSPNATNCWTTGECDATSRSNPPTSPMLTPWYSLPGGGRNAPAWAVAGAASAHSASHRTATSGRTVSGRRIVGIFAVHRHAGRPA